MPRLKEYVHPRYTNDEIEDWYKIFDNYINTVDFPYLSKFATEYGIIRDDLYIFPTFVPLLKKAKAKCEQYLIDKLNQDKVNFVPFIFLLKSMHDFRDNSAIEVSGKDGKPVSLEFTGKSVQDLQAMFDKVTREHKTSNTGKKK